MGLRRWLCTVGVVSCSACSPVADDPGVLVDEGDLVRLFAHGDAEVCGGTLADIENRIRAVRAHLGLDLQGLRPIDYHWYVSPELFNASLSCPDLGRQCFSPEYDAVFAYDLPQVHEIVHAALRDLGNADSSFVEGVAMYLGAQTWYPGETIPTGYPPLSDVFGTRGDDFGWEYYMVAGRFTALLAELHGPQVIAELMEASSSADDRAQSIARIEAVTGDDFDELRSLFDGTSVCPSFDWSHPVAECRGSPRPWQAGVWSWTTSLDCADPEVSGSSNGVRIRHALLEVRDTGVYDITGAGIGVFASLVGCGGCDAGAIGSWPAADQVRARLAAGTYVVTLMSSRPGAVDEAGVSIVPVRLDGREVSIENETLDRSIDAKVRATTTAFGVEYIE